MSDHDTVAAALLPFFASVAEQSRERALMLSRQRTAALAPRELLSFVVGTETYALPLGQVQEICRLEVLTQVPRTRPETLGIMSLRGEVVPVVDLAAVLGLSPGAAGAQHASGTKALRAILLTDQQGPLALMVQAVQGVVRLLPQDMLPRPFALGGQHPELITGLGRTVKGTVALLDGPGLLRHLERLS